MAGLETKGGGRSTTAVLEVGKSEGGKNRRCFTDPHIPAIDSKIVDLMRLAKVAIADLDEDLKVNIPDLVENDGVTTVGALSEATAREVVDNLAG